MIKLMEISVHLEVCVLLVVGYITLSVYLMVFQGKVNGTIKWALCLHVLENISEGEARDEMLGHTVETCRSLGNFSSISSEVAWERLVMG